MKKIAIVVLASLLLLATAAARQPHLEGCRLRITENSSFVNYSTNAAIVCKVRRCRVGKEAVRWSKDGAPIQFGSDGSSMAVGEENSSHFWSPYLGLKQKTRSKKSELIMSLVTPELAGTYTCSLCQPGQPLRACPVQASTTIAVDGMYPATRRLLPVHPPLIRELLRLASPAEMKQSPGRAYLSRKSDFYNQLGSLNAPSRLNFRLLVLRPSSAATPAAPPSVRWLQESNGRRRLHPPIEPVGPSSILQVPCQPDDLGVFSIPRELQNRLECYKSSVQIQVTRDTIGIYSCKVRLNGSLAFKTPPFRALSVPSVLVPSAPRAVAPSANGPATSPPLSTKPPRRVWPQELRIPTISFSSNTSKCAGSSLTLVCRIRPSFAKMQIRFLPAAADFDANATVLGSYSLNSSSGLWIGSRFVIASGRSQDGVLEVTLANLTVLNSGWYSCSGEVLDKKYERWPEAKGMHLDVVPHCFRQERGFQLHSIAYTAIGVGAALLVSLVVSTLLYLYYLQKRRSAPLVKRLRIVNMDNGELYQRNRTENSDSPLLGQSSYYRQESLDRPGWSLTVPEVVVEQVGPRGRRLFNRRGGSSRGSGASEANREVRYIIPACQVFELDRKRIHVVRKIGQGAFGTVHSGQYTFSGTNIHNVAIKMLKRDYSEEEMIALVKEIEIMKMMRSNPHPNIIKLVGVCTKGGPVLLLTELALYGNLRDFLKQRPVTSKQADYMNVLPDTREVCFTPCVRPVQLLHFSRDVARALQFMADIKIVHRDIAARNILVANSDEKGKIVAKVSDFGLTRNVSDKDYYRVITEGKLPVKWLAPECLKSQYFFSKSDVWAYGILLYEIFSKGETPYPGVSPNGVLPYLEAGGVNPQPVLAGEGLYGLMRDCWAWESRDRPSFESILARLDGLERCYEHTDLP
ncbi:hypothetical protein BOX15_Mlig025458g1 [Macrostomum lignano]|uniref:receptor protein-tyrosine kinase n=1 Tax=Macrostomum lignano TaxID=282301 RepID=A0A267DJE3_9PLAT|nr:hypothetical protein BOX15_Mlig025458g1 [Macrostomum lignano]